jgi:hypothetical protein
VLHGLGAKPNSNNNGVAINYNAEYGHFIVSYLFISLA